MNRGLLRVFGIGAWVNSAWDFNYYFVHGGIFKFLHSWLVFVPLFAIFFAYPIVGLLLIFGKSLLRTEAHSSANIGLDMSGIDIDLEA